MNFKEELEQRTREAEEIIKSYLPKEEGFAKNMAEAMNYSMLSGGKRLRPVFMREVYSMSVSYTHLTLPTTPYV